VRRTSRQLCICDYHSRTPRERHNDFQKVQGTSDHRAFQDIIFYQRFSIEKGVRIGARVLSQVHDHPGHGPSIISMTMCIALCEHGVEGILAHMPIGDIELGLR
jgi:hypothetical protein